MEVVKRPIDINGHVHWPCLLRAEVMLKISYFSLERKENIRLRVAYVYDDK
jgi:hypothetical protein